MVDSSDFYGSQGSPPGLRHHAVRTASDGEPYSAAETHCLDLQESFVEAIDRAAAALRVVHDDRQSRELRSLMSIRRAPARGCANIPSA